MELVSVSKALDIIKHAAPGDTLHIGLYRDAIKEDGYNELSIMLGYNGAEINNGPHKIYSTKVINDESYGTAWIAGASYKPDREPGLYDDITGSVPVIDGARFYSWDYGNLYEIAEAITNNTNVYAIYSEAEDKIILTAKTPGLAGNIKIQPPIEISYWDNPPTEFISGLELDFDTLEQPALQVWIKTTSLPAPLQNENFDIRINIIVDEPSTLIDLSSRWLWDGYTEDMNNISTINWGDNSALEYVSDVTNIVHTYNSVGTYDIKISGLHLCNNNMIFNLPINEIEFRTPQIVFTNESITEGINSVIGDVFISKTI